MLKIYNLAALSAEQQSDICRRNTDSDQSIKSVVEGIISDVKLRGDTALKLFAEKFDGIALKELFIGKSEIQELAAQISATEKDALNTAFGNIWKFHSAQLKAEDKVETSPGVTCWREARPIERVGLYVPGGTAVLPSTFLMLGIPALIAGCRNIVVCSPPQKNGKVNPYLAYCANLLNIDRIYLTGGAQAIAAMAFGTETIPKVDKIFGPGNQYVTRAKSIIQSDSQTAIDMPAGPSEVLVLADETADPIFVAADLLAQAEHGPDSQAVLVSNSRALIENTIIQLKIQLKELPRKDIAAMAISNSFAVLCTGLTEGMKFSNLYAPEHLILATDQWQGLIPEIINAGSVFLGHNSPESAGDYASGTNHTLPTSSFARAYSGVSVDSFIKKITFQHLSEQGIQELGPAVEILANLEGLQAHQNAVSVRLEKLQNQSESTDLN